MITDITKTTIAALDGGDANALARPGYSLPASGGVDNQPYANGRARAALTPRFISSRRLQN